MAARFVDSFEGVVSIKSNAMKSKNPSTSVGIQSIAVSDREIECQTNKGEDISCQTETIAMAPPTTENLDYNWHTLNDFLLRSEPMILRTLAENRRTARLFAVYESAITMDESETSAVLEHTLRSESDWPTDGGAQAVRVDWNASGTTVGVACGRITHDDWCTHRGYVMTWNIDRGQRLNPSKADRVYETASSCCTYLAFHPVSPNLFAASTYTGDLMIWSLSDEGEPLATVQLANQTPINCIAWLPTATTMTTTTASAASDSSTTAMMLASGGADGRVLIWSVPSKGRQLALVKAFQLTVANLPRTIRGKVGGENKATGVSSVSFARAPLSSRFVVGTETGGVFQCTIDTGRSNAIDQRVSIVGGSNSESTVCYDPVVLSQKSHNGSVYTTSFHPRESIVAASCGSDGFVRLSGAFQTTPAAEIDTGSGASYDFSWSPLRSCVFALATSIGRLLIFDLSRATDRPIANIDTTTNSSSTQDRSGSLISVAFNTRRANIVATGDASGYVKIWNLGDAFATAQTDEDRFLRELLTSDQEDNGDAK